MLFVIVRIGCEKYAISARDIVEIAPNTKATSIPGTPRCVAGLIQYRGCAIPLLDLGELCRGAACAETPTTRILIVKRERDGGGLLGIRAERVTSAVPMDEGAFEAPGVTAAPYVTGVMLTGSAIMLRIELRRLLDQNASELFALQPVGR